MSETPLTGPGAGLGVTGATTAADAVYGGYGEPGGEEEVPADTDVEDTAGPGDDLAAGPPGGI